MSALRGPTTIRARVALGTFVLLAGALAVAGVTVDEVVRETTRHAFDGRLTTEAEALATLTHIEGGKVELEFEDEVMTAFVSSRSGAYFQVWTAQRLVERSKSLRKTDGLPRPDDAFFAPLESGTERRVRRRTIDGPYGSRVRLLELAVGRTSEGSDEATEHAPGAPRTVVVVQVGREIAALDATRSEARLALAVALPLALLLGTAGAFVVARRATAPLARLAGEAEAIGVGSLERRLDLAATEGELRALAQQLNDAFARLAAAVERERRFSSDVAHELRTPLAVARTTLELALLQDREPEAYREAIRSALDANKRLEQLVGSLLFLGRAETARQKNEVVDVRGPVAAAVQALAPLAAEKGAALKATLGDEPLLVRGEPLLLDRLASNLVENALLHSGGAKDVDVLLEGKNGTVTLSVLDRGAGFPPALLSRPFERFARGDASRARATGGAGLGLAIVAAIARAHGGEATLANREGGGAAVHVRLPRCPSVRSP